MFTKEVLGSVLLTDSYQTIYPHEDDDHARDPMWIEGWIFLHELEEGDEVQLYFSAYDPVGQILRGYDSPIITGIQEPVPSFHIGAIVSRWLKVEIKQRLPLPTSSYKNVNFAFNEVS